METPVGIKRYELTASFVWIEEGIMYSVAKNDAPPPTLETLKEDIARLREIAGNKKVCIISESSNRSEVPNKEIRDYMAEELAQIVQAWAIIARTPLSKMLANLFFAFKPPPYPVRMFTDMNEAKEWIRKHCR